MNRPRLGKPVEGGMRSGTATTLLCLAGLVVAGVGLAYCVHLGAERGDDASTSAPALRYITPSTSPVAVPPTVGPQQAPSTVAPGGGLSITRSKMLLGTVDTLSSTELAIHMSDGRRHTITLTDDTHYESAHGSTGSTSTTSKVRVGDVVVVHVLIKGDQMVADLVVDGRVTTSSPG